MAEALPGPEVLPEPEWAGSARADQHRRSPRVCLVAAPLEGRSGVYRSVRDLVSEARSRHWEWSALLGMRPTAPAPTEDGVAGVEEWTVGERGMAGVRRIAEVVASHDAAAHADVVITLITQSDLALARLQGRLDSRWVAYVRGLPWPARGEQGLPKRVAQRVVESRALRRADEVWATTTVLANQVRGVRDPRVVPAGIPLDGRRLGLAPSAGGRVVWAGRMAVDKRPHLFSDLMRSVPYAGTMYGVGPLERDVTQHAPGNVSMEGWVAPDRLWHGAAAFVGTSSREAFGRSAVEAAAAGVPTILDANYGAAPLLFTDHELYSLFVLESEDPAVWADSLTTLMSDEALWHRTSEHVRDNAQRLSIARSVDHVAARLRELVNP